MVLRSWDSTIFMTMKPHGQEVEDTWQRMFATLPLSKSQIALKTYTLEKMKVSGQRAVQVRYKGQVRQLRLIVVEGNGPTLLGRNWLKYLKLDWPQILHVAAASQFDELLREYGEIFRDELGTLKTFKATLSVKPGAAPKFFRPRSVPFAIRDAVGKELDRLEAASILEKVSYSEWAAPIVTVPKKDGTFLVCGNYKVTVNPVLETDQYPLPTPEELFAKLVGGTKFTKLDLTQAYAQNKLDESSSEYVTINTHQGLYRYKRLPCGVASAPAIFQKFMEAMLQGIPGVAVYVDDILITAKTDEEHLATLREVTWLEAKAAKMPFHAVVCRIFRVPGRQRGSACTTRQGQGYHGCPTAQGHHRTQSLLGVAKLLW